jgi:hypothetical protein
MKSFLQSIALYLCSCMLIVSDPCVMATSTGECLHSLPKTMRWLIYALVSSVWPTALFQSEKTYHLYNLNWKNSLPNQCTCVWLLIWYTLRIALSIATTQPISLSPFRLVALSHRRLDVLSLAKHTRSRSARYQNVAISLRLYYMQIANPLI